MGTIHNICIYGANSSAPELFSDVTYIDETDTPIHTKLEMNLHNFSAELEMVGRISQDAMFVMMGIRDIVLSCCPNKRVVHLTKHGKKKRTRKKNLHRAIKILEGMK